MIRIKNQEFRIKLLKKITFVTLFLILTALFSATTFAADSSPSAATKSRFDLLREEIASRAAQYIPEMNKKLNNKAYTGTIKTLSSGSIVLATAIGEKTITLNEFTDYIWKGKSLNMKSLGVGNFIAALGDLDDKEALVTKRVIRLEPPLEKEFIFGTVLSVDKNTITIQTTDKKNSTLSVSKDTDYLTAKAQVLSLKDIKIDRPLIAVGVKSKDNTIQTQFIYFPPYAGTLKPKVASSSAKIATPSSSSNSKTVTGK